MRSARNDHTYHGVQHPPPPRDARQLVERHSGLKIAPACAVANEEDSDRRTLRAVHKGHEDKALGSTYYPEEPVNDKKARHLDGNIPRKERGPSSER